MFKEPIYKKLTAVVAALALLCLILTAVLIAVPAGEPSAPNSGDANKETPPKVENVTLGETEGAISLVSVHELALTDTTGMTPELIERLEAILPTEE